ncbi:CocE/NonD family hydrolase [Catenuloplanes japonicus]|uniref:CocE/NonD family hydrolase n=1 Tax=Catenuloplanes japonicus TaxID=33876 RepID=UPI000524D929|nr:CocE/NonD family hydrolase [Catenuloplanes japonicus]
MRLPALMSALLVAVALAVSPSSPASAATPVAGPQAVEIAAGDGTRLAANVIAPRASGTYPLIVFIASWGLNDAEYLAQAARLATGGYVVVSYTPRGFWLSGGDIDTAGPRDVADLSTVLDWALAHTAADPSKVGVGGVSYGAGIGLIGAAFDPRIRAVTALSGWTDLVYSLYGNDTRHLQSTLFLQLAAQLLGSPGPELSGVLADFFANRDVPAIKAWGRTRSAASYLDLINVHRPAVLIANAWSDTFFPPNQLTAFYTGLTGPKRLELAPGDHAVAEAGGLLGLPNPVWTSVSRWFDHHLRGVANGIDAEPPVRVRPWNGPAEGYADWADLTGSVRRYPLGAIRPLDGTGLLGDPATTAWSKPVPLGLDTTANGGIALISNGLSAITGVQQSVWLPSVSRLRAGVWASSRPAVPVKVRGVPRVHLDLESAPAHGTLVAYLYDLDLAGTAKLITHAPVSWSASTGAVDVDLHATSYDVPAGHSLTLVVDSEDPLYLDANTLGTSVSLGAGSYLDLPVM